MGLPKQYRTVLMLRDVEEHFRDRSSARSHRRECKGAATSRPLDDAQGLAGPCRSQRQGHVPVYGTPLRSSCEACVRLLSTPVNQ